MKTKILSITSGRARRGIITQMKLANQQEPEEALELATVEATCGRWEIREALENGAAVEPGPLTATIKTRMALILHARKRA
jgi:hypothetical protein